MIIGLMRVPGSHAALAEPGPRGAARMGSAYAALMSPRWHHPLTAATLLAILLAAWVLRIDDAALHEVDAGWKRALATFAVARALNAVISVAQGTELAVQPAGLGVTLAPGQALDPINDLIEQFSTLMLLASVAFGAQRVLIGIGAWWPMSLALTAVAVG